MSQTTKKKSNRPKKSSKINFIGKSAMMKELQRTISFQCYHKVFALGQSASTDNLNTQVFEKYHGKANDPDDISYSHQFLQGIGPFQSLFEKEVDPTNNSVKMTLKKMYHLNDYSVPIADPKDPTTRTGISKEVVTWSTLSYPTLLPGRTIWAHGKDIHTTGKKALAWCQQSKFKDVPATGNYPSGENYVSYLQELRKAMYQILVLDAKKQKSDNARDAADAAADDQQVASEKVEDEASGAGRDPDSAANEMPVGWTFPGFIAFALWGFILPDDMDPEHKAIATFAIDDVNYRDHHAKGSASRASARASIADDESRSRKGAPVGAGRGASKDEILYAAYISSTMEGHIIQERMALREQKMNSVKLRLQTVKEDMDSLRDAIDFRQLANPNEHPDNVALHEYIRLMREKREILAELKVMEQQTLEPVESKHSRLVWDAIEPYAKPAPASAGTKRAVDGTPIVPTNIAANLAAGGQDVSRLNTPTPFADEPSEPNTDNVEEV
jgi:hypothetical protein